MKSLLLFYGTSSLVSSTVPVHLHPAFPCLIPHLQFSLEFWWQACKTGNMTHTQKQVWEQEDLFMRSRLSIFTALLISSCFSWPKSKDGDSRSSYGYFFGDRVVAWQTQDVSSKSRRFFPSPVIFVFLKTRWRLEGVFSAFPASFFVKDDDVRRGLWERPLFLLSSKWKDGQGSQAWLHEATAKTDK